MARVRQHLLSTWVADWMANERLAIGLQADPEAKALELLMTYLTPHQRLTMSKHGFIYERGGSQWYVLLDGRNLMPLDDDGQPFSSSISPLAYLVRGMSAGYYTHYPWGDLLLSQLLLLRTEPSRIQEACRGLVYHWCLRGSDCDVLPMLIERTYWPPEEARKR